jgi:isocitrate dehydrogenase (NAD+)
VSPTAATPHDGCAATLIPGDGIGPDVMTAARRVVDATGVRVEWHRHDIGITAIERGLEPLPAATLDSVRVDRIALKGPTATPIGRAGFASVNVGLRRRLGLYAQARPCRSRLGVPAPFADVDLVVIRETTEDLYAGVEFEMGSPGAHAVVEAARARNLGEDIGEDAGVSVKFLTAAASRRMLEFALDYARRHRRRKITVVHKATVMRATDGVFLEVARDVASHATDIEFDEYQVDNVCGQLVRRPHDFDVLAMGMQYGDIVSDVAAGLVGGVGMVAGVNVGDDAVVFEPAHGTAPRLAGRRCADPTAAILCGVMLLEHIGAFDEARRVETALDAVIAQGDAVTYDLRGAGDERPSVGTEAMADAVIASMS